MNGIVILEKGVPNPLTKLPKAPSVSFVSALGSPICKNIVDGLLPTRYSEMFAEKEATGFGDLNSQWRTSAAKRFFFVRIAFVRQFQWWAWVGIPSGMPVSVVSGSPTPFSARPPHLAMSCGFHTHTHGGLHAWY